MIENGKLINCEVRIENCSKCNATCTVCPREKMTRPKVIMGWGHFVNLVEQAYRLGATDIAIFGYGEPLLDRDVAPKVGYATNRGMTTHITTNASLLTEDITHDLLDAGLKHIRFSLHGTTPKLFHNVHRGLDWMEVVGNIMYFLKKNKERGKPCTIHITAMPIHNEPISEIRETWERAADYLEIWMPHGWAGAMNQRPLTEERLSKCFRPFSGPVQIQADGKVIPCCFMTNAEVVLGDTHESDLVTILTDSKYGAFRKKHEQGTLETLPCNKCDQLNVGDNPLLYSSRDLNREVHTTSTAKFDLKRKVG